MEKVMESVNHLLDKVAKQVRSKPRSLVRPTAIGVVGIVFLAFVLEIVPALGLSPGVITGCCFNLRHASSDYKDIAVAGAIVIGAYVAFVLVICLFYVITWIVARLSEYAIKSLHALAITGALLFTAGFISLFWATWIS
jgi:hypothetical protein